MASLCRPTCVSVTCHGVFVAGLDVDAADGTLLVGGQPLVHTLDVKQVHARQASARKTSFPAVFPASVRKKKLLLLANKLPGITLGKY